MFAGEQICISHFYRLEDATASASDKWQIQLQKVSVPELERKEIK